MQEGNLLDWEQAEADIISAIFKLLQDFRDVTFEWVESHQDDNDNTPIEERELPVCLNIACDLGAKECMENCIARQPPAQDPWKMQKPHCSWEPTW